MIAARSTRDVLRRMLLTVMACALALSMMLAVTGCSDAQSAIEEKQQEEAEQFDTDVENAAGNASEAEAAVEEMNEAIDAAEDAANQ